MESIRFGISSTRFLLNSLLVVSLVPVIGASNALAQSKRVVTRSGSSVRVITYTEIPEATEPCTPEESDWWTRIRTAGNDLQQKEDEKSKTRFALLLYEGMQKSYRIPLTDRPPQVLSHGKGRHSDMARKMKINGTVVLSVEYRAEGSVGDVQIMERVGFGLDEKEVQAARQALFLPAVKDGAFVTQLQEVRIGFSSRRLSN